MRRKAWRTAKRDKRQSIDAICAILARFYCCCTKRNSNRIRCVKYGTTTLIIFAALSVSLALAEDFKTVNGKEYKNATVIRAEPDGIAIKFSGGLVKIPFTELSKEVQERFHYDPTNAAQFNAAVQAEVARSNAAGPQTSGTTPSADAMDQRKRRTPTPTASPIAVPTATATASSGGIGLMYLVPSYKKDPPPRTNTPGLTNPYIQGMLWRETWERLDPNGTGPNFSWLDDAISKSERHSKLSPLEI